MILTHERTLPPGMALVETGDGRWFPALAPDEVSPLRWVHLIEGPPDIPPAIDRDPCQGYQQREEAIAVCWAWHEAASLPCEWQELAGRTEVYPERAAWYLEQIAHLTGNGRSVRLYRTYGYTTLIAGQGCEGDRILTTHGINVDEMIEDLYLRVYEWSCHHDEQQLHRQHAR